jgi:hypothetical protein
MVTKLADGEPVCGSHYTEETGVPWLPDMKTSETSLPAKAQRMAGEGRARPGAGSRARQGRGGDAESVKPDATILNPQPAPAGETSHDERKADMGVERCSRGCGNVKHRGACKGVPQRRNGNGKAAGLPPMADGTLATLALNEATLDWIWARLDILQKAAAVAAAIGN